MKPITTPETNFNYRGPTPDIGDLPCHRARPGLILSEWDLTKAERLAIMRGARVELGIHTEPIPPVQLSVVSRDSEDNLAYVDEHGPFSAITAGDLDRATLEAHAASLGLLLVHPADDADRPRPRFWQRLWSRLRAAVSQALPDE
jgi:hypothetical protein